MIKRAVIRVQLQTLRVVLDSSGEVAEVFLGMIILGILWYALDALVLAPFEQATVERWGMVRQVETTR